MKILKIIIILLFSLFFLNKSVLANNLCCKSGYDNSYFTTNDESSCYSTGGTIVLMTICNSQGGITGGAPLGTLKGLGRFSHPSNIDIAGNNLESIVSIIIGFLTILAGLWFFIIFITGGLSYISAGGESGKVEEARKKMTNGVIGVIIVVAAYSVIFIVGKVLGLDILNPAQILKDLGPGGGN